MGGCTLTHPQSANLGCPTDTYRLIFPRSEELLFAPEARKSRQMGALTILLKKHLFYVRC
jgi:hypothetical protein